MKIASLFSGIGGFEKGILQAIPDAEIVFSSEIDKYARQIYKKNFGEYPHGDITKIKASNIPNHDILCGGFPCQAFSIAGKRRGFEDTRGTLFFEIMRIVKVKRPKLLYFENVRGLLSHDEGRTFQTILRSMDDLGYDAEWQVFNSKNHGVPQNRERVFIIGHLRGAGTRPIFPITESSGLSNEEEPTVYCLDANYYKGVAQQSRSMIQQLNNPTHSNNRIYDSDGLSPTINCAEGGNRQPFITCHSTLPRSSTSGKGGTGHLQRDDDLSYCCDANNNIAVEVNQRIRRLTPVECERLQGFPQLESYININIHNNTICVDLQKSYVNVEIRNHKQQKYAGNVEKSEVKENVSYVEQNLNTNNLPINKPAQKNVVINCVEETVEIHNQKKSYSFANYVESQNSYHQHIKIVDFVHLLAGINITLKNAMHFGKEVLHQNEQYLIQVQNGKLFVKLYGREMMQSANDAKTDLTTLKKHLKYITSNHLNLESVDYNWIISYCYVINAITGCIQTKTQINNLLNLEIKTVFGYTFGISDTQRYKCLGNAVTVNVIEFISQHIFKMLQKMEL